MIPHSRKEQSERWAKHEVFRLPPVDFGNVIEICSQIIYLKMLLNHFDNMTQANAAKKITTNDEKHLENTHFKRVTTFSRLVA